MAINVSESKCHSETDQKVKSNIYEDKQEDHATDKPTLLKPVNYKVCHSQTLNIYTYKGKIYEKN